MDIARSLRRVLTVLLLAPVAGCSKHPSKPVVDTTPPQQVQNPSARAGSDSSIFLNWNPVPSDAATYEIRVSTDLSDLQIDGAAADDTVIVDAPNTQATISGLTEATTYFFSIRARDAAGNSSPFSRIASARTLESPPQFVAEWGSRGTAAGQLLRPTAIAVGAQGHSSDNVYVADDGNSRVLQFNATGSAIRQWGSHCDLSDGTGCMDPDGAGPLETGDGQFGRVDGIAVDFWGHVYVADFTNHRIVEFTADGSFVGKWTVPNRPTDVDVDNAGYVYVGGRGETLIYDQARTLISRVHVNYDVPMGVTGDGLGNVFMVPMGADRSTLFKLSINGALLGKWGGSGNICERGEFFVPNRMDADGAGNVYIPDGCRRIQKFSGTGDYLGDFGNSAFEYPRDVAVQDWSGYIYVLDDADNPNVIVTKVKKFYSEHAVKRLSMRERGIAKRVNRLR